MKHIHTFESFLNESKKSISFSELWKGYKAASDVGASMAKQSKIDYLSKYFNNPEEIEDEISNSIKGRDLNIREYDKLRKSILEKHYNDNKNFKG